MSEEFKKDKADFVTGDFQAEESRKLKGSGAGGEAITRGGPDEILVGPAAYDQESTGADVASESDQSDGGDT